MAVRKLFHERILDACDDHGDNIALSDAETGETVSFEVLRTKSTTLAHILRHKYALKKGNTVLCFMPNNIHYPVIFLASALIGAPFCGICTTLSKEEINEWLERTASCAIFITSELLEKIIPKAIEMDVPIFVLNKRRDQPGMDLEMLLKDNFNSSTNVTGKEIELDDVLLMALSSGTTGSPKCALLTHRNFNAATDALKTAVFDKLSARGERSRATIALLPFYHASGFWALCYCLMSGHHSVVMNHFDANLFLGSISDYTVDTINIVPSIIHFLTKNGPQIKKRFALDLSSVKTVLCGSAAINNEQVNQFLELFPDVNNFLTGYGMTEIVLLSHITPLDLTPNEYARHKNSCGKLLPGFEAKIVSVDTSEEVLKPNESGELWLKSECVMRGYLNEEQPCTDLDGFYHTGDLVHTDAHGFYYIDGRLKSMIKVNGMQVSPLELERVLLLHTDVLEAAVIGILDADRGEVPKAFVVLATDNRIENTMDDKISNIRDFVHSRVAPFKQLSGGIIPITALPKTPSGKIIKGMLKELNSTNEPQKAMVEM